MFPNRHDIDARPMPWWTVLATAVILQCGTQISLLFKYDQGVADYYLPTALSVILIHWWGPKVVIPMMYINATFSTYFWGIPADRWADWFLYAIPETSFTILSWFLFRRVFKGKYWLPDIQSVVLFLVVGILVPIIPEIFALQTLLVFLGDQTMETFWTYVTRNWLGEFTSTFGLALPVLFYVTPVMKKAGLLRKPDKDIPEPYPIRRRVVVELSLIFCVLLLFVFLVEFHRFWYIYGLFSLLVGLRFGFGPAVLTNYFIFLITYILPKIIASINEVPKGDADVNAVFLGASLLFVSAALTGRVISDIRITKGKLEKQNQELDQTNKELDRFVYSVSHDLSAPLKSILGLVNISRITKEPNEHVNYLDRIETSVVKLEAFISEILDYSRNKRQDIAIEQIRLKELCAEILENLKYTNDFSRISVDLSQLELYEIRQDKTRLKIILNNLLTNAVKFQKRFDGHLPYIKISSRKTSDNDVLIEIEDNGEGIKSEMQERIFDMFYRGSEKSPGSGLGLYIAKEAAMKINGRIKVFSEYGKGSKFTVELKNLNAN
ncbi:MAG TPA: ATP-binding protein [Chryseosolibacter sp.]|nr:ATP-binding protein [Chryseosolibacter sp.]